MGCCPGRHIADGARLDALLTGKPDAAREQTFLMHYPHAPHRSNYFTCYRRGDWRVIYHYYPSEASEGSHYQLYNLRHDPFEQYNLAASKPDQLKVMIQGLAAAMEQQGALYPVNSADTTTPLRPRAALIDNRCCPALRNPMRCFASGSKLGQAPPVNHPETSFSASRAAIRTVSTRACVRIVAFPSWIPARRDGFESHRPL